MNDDSLDDVQQRRERTAQEHQGIPDEPRQVIESDRQYASELLADLKNGDEPRLWVAAQWFRKARVEQALERSLSVSSTDREPPYQETAAKFDSYWTEKVDQGFHQVVHLEQMADVFAFKSERQCLHGCGVVKVVHHQSEGGRDVHWTEFWRDGEKIEAGRTPACVPAEAAIPAGGRPAQPGDLTHDQCCEKAGRPAIAAAGEG